MSNLSLIGPAAAFASDAGPATWFSVKINDQGHLPVQTGRKIIFHGINKSGSLCLTKVMMDGYAKSGREKEFHSHYHLEGVSLAAFVKLIETATPPRFFVGHQLFGNVDLPRPETVMITQVRHPIPRMMSCYEWLRKKHCIKTGSQAGFPDFETFIQNGAGKSHSQIVQFGAGYGEEKQRLLGSLKRRDLLERSIENIEQHVLFTGIAELFEETIFAVAHLCGISQVPAWKRDERNVGRPMASTLPQSSIDLLHDVYRYDFELYNWAKGRLEALLNKIEISGDLEAYRKRCASQYKDRL